MKKIIVLLLAVVAAVVFFNYKRTENFLDCEFKFNKISNVVMADIELTGSMNILALLQGVDKIVAAAKSDELKASLTVGLTVRNPNDKPAVLEGLQYILFLDEWEVAEGALDNSVSVPPSGEAEVDLPCDLVLTDVLKSDRLDAISSMVTGFALGNFDASRIKISVKPYFNILGKQVVPPSYITISGDELMKRK